MCFRYSSEETLGFNTIWTLGQSAPLGRRQMKAPPCPPSEQIHTLVNCDGVEVWIEG